MTNFECQWVAEKQSHGTSRSFFLDGVRALTNQASCLTDSTPDSQRLHTTNMISLRNHANHAGTLYSFKGYHSPSEMNATQERSSFLDTESPRLCEGYKSASVKASPTGGKAMIDIEMPRYIKVRSLPCSNAEHTVGITSWLHLSPRIPP